MGTKCKWSSPGTGELSIAFPTHELLATVKPLQCGRLNLSQTQYGRQRCASTISPRQICLSFSHFPGLCVGWTVVDETNYLTINNLVREEGFDLVLERSLHSPCVHWFWVHAEADPHDVGGMCSRCSLHGRQEADRKRSRTKHLQGLSPSDLTPLVWLHLLKF